MNADIARYYAAAGRHGALDEALAELNALKAKIEKVPHITHNLRIGDTDEWHITNPDLAHKCALNGGRCMFIAPAATNQDTT